MISAICPQKPKFQQVRIPVARLPKRAAVTIGIGFFCGDGIVLCADTQITFPQSHKYYEHKIYPRQTANWTTAFTFAGNPILMKQFDQRFDDAMRQIGPPFTVAGISDVVEDVLAGMSALDNDPTGLHMLGAISVPKVDIRLLKTEQKVVTKVDKHDYIGIGDSSILRYLIPLLTKTNGYTSKQAAFVGVYLTLQAKRYVEGCGGDTDVMTVNYNGNISLTEADRIEQQLLMLEFHLGKTASRFFDERVPDDEFGESCERLVRALKDDHFQMGINVA